jgi:hypothetical protein
VWVAALGGGFNVTLFLPTIAGLATIPFVVKPIDSTIDTAMEMSVTKVGRCRLTLSNPS